MAKIEERPTVTMNVVIRLTEEEAAALDALTGYGLDTFLGVFYKHLGRSYLQPHEDGLRSLFDSVRDGDCNVRGILKRAQDAREVFNGSKKAIVERPVSQEPAK